MRYTKAAHVRFLGESGLGKQYVTHARTLLGKLMHTAVEGGGQLVAARKHVLADGTRISLLGGVTGTPVITIDTRETKGEQLLDVYVALLHERVLNPGLLQAIVIGAFGKENLLASARSFGYAPSNPDVQREAVPKTSFNYPYRYRGNLYMVETVYNEEYSNPSVCGLEGVPPTEYTCYYPEPRLRNQYIYMPGGVTRNYEQSLRYAWYVADQGLLPWGNHQYSTKVGPIVNAVVCNDDFVFVACTDYVFEGGFVDHTSSDLVRIRQRIDLYLNDGSDTYAGSWFGEGSGLATFGQEGYMHPFEEPTYWPSLTALPDGLASITVFVNRPLPGGYKPDGLEQILSPDRRAVFQIRRFSGYFERIFQHVRYAAVASNKEHVFVFVHHYATSDVEDTTLAAGTTVYRYTHEGVLVNTTELDTVWLPVTPPRANNLFVYTYARAVDNGVLQVRLAATLDILREVPAELVRDMLAFGDGGLNRAFAIHDYDNMFQ